MSKERKKHDTTGHHVASDIATAGLALALTLGAGGIANAQQAKPAQNDSAATTQQVNRAGQQRDPNLPQIMYNTAAPIYWTYGDEGTIPSVQFKNPPDQGTYMGYNENGSMIRNAGNGKIYYWKLKNSDVRTGTLTEAAKSVQDVSLDTLAALQNPSNVIKERLAMNGRGPMPKQPVTVAQNPPPPPKTSTNPFGPDVANRLAGLLPGAGGATGKQPVEGAGVSGNKASVIRAGDGFILTFDQADGTKSKPYKVVRPKVMGNNPQAATADISGTWIDADNKLLFTVNGDKSVVGKEMPPQIIQMLTGSGVPQR